MFAKKNGPDAYDLPEILPIFAQRIIINQKLSSYEETHVIVAIHGIVDGLCFR